MSKVDNLIARISDESLRAELRSEWAKRTPVVERERIVERRIGVRFPFHHRAQSLNNLGIARPLDLGQMYSVLQSIRMEVDIRPSFLLCDEDRYIEIMRIGVFLGDLCIGNRSDLHFMGSPIYMQPGYVAGVIDFCAIDEMGLCVIGSLEDIAAR
jgi:hypothetical protein